jgi:hypothetical protein
MSYPRPLTRHTVEREQLAQFFREGQHRLGNGRCMTYEQIGKATGIPFGTVHRWTRDLHPAVFDEIKRARVMATIMAEATRL